MKKVFFSILLVLVYFTIQAQDSLIIKSPTAQLFTRVYSPEHTETVFLLHGGPGVPDDLLPVVDLLKANYRVIVFDQRGSLRSPCEPNRFRMEDYIADIHAIATYFQLESFHLFGHSWGGLYAQIYAQAHPEKISSLFLCSPGSGTGKVWRQTEKEVLRYNKRVSSGKEWAYLGWQSLLSLFGNDRAAQRSFHQVVLNYQKGFATFEIDTAALQRIRAKSISKTRKQIKKYPILQAVPNAKYPIRITYGTGDIYEESKQDVYRRYPSASFAEIEKSGHFPWAQNPEAFRKIIQDFYLGKKQDTPAVR